MRNNVTTETGPKSLFTLSQRRHGMQKQFHHYCLDENESNTSIGVLTYRFVIQNQVFVEACEQDHDQRSRLALISEF
ncbi:hypothetical protein Htur_4682 (plasmid) [Haloterrigena turkmenica DSM 5511]|uniref:Uncharacterized protein n=1 Tax=Haloterrigena turkmenica (strain ATCC 51198 / DSM 5511 / JCM 9101 / NCIMB 13204 / VKM B-1734 / 4k) TaxID=543526 RepID=D2S264_HALTV|nr:hypothetical protein Htur_4682 [Haloterrigena turkmenica DSM 5511]